MRTTKELNYEKSQSLRADQGSSDGITNNAGAFTFEKSQSLRADQGSSDCGISSVLILQGLGAGFV